MKRHHFSRPSVMTRIRHCCWNKSICPSLRNNRLWPRSDHWDWYLKFFLSHHINGTCNLQMKDTMSLGRATALQTGACLVAVLLSNVVELIFFPSVFALHCVISPFPWPGEQLSEKGSPSPNMGSWCWRKVFQQVRSTVGWRGMGWRGVRNERWDPLFIWNTADQSLECGFSFNPSRRSFSNTVTWKWHHTENFSRGTWIFWTSNRWLLTAPSPAVCIQDVPVPFPYLSWARPLGLEGSAMLSLQHLISFHHWWGRHHDCLKHPSG